MKTVRWFSRAGPLTVKLSCLESLDLTGFSACVCFSVLFFSFGAGYLEFRLPEKGFASLARQTESFDLTLHFPRRYLDPQFCTSLARQWGLDQSGFRRPEIYVFFFPIFIGGLDACCFLNSFGGLDACFYFLISFGGLTCVCVCVLFSNLFRSL